ncbi:MAG: hypothetical protein F6K30_16320 [Cyanothece sp. SIO2G6]|nr:hypothetical protein [Cyanothece sp. SIO2G6]
MTPRDQLLAEIAHTPDFVLEEVLDFLLFTRTRRQQPSNHSTVSPVSSSPKPIWEELEAFADQLPNTIAQTLPTDGAAQIDHYLYGSPKQDQ